MLKKLWSSFIPETTMVVYCGKLTMLQKVQRGIRRFWLRKILKKQFIDISIPKINRIYPEL